MDVKLSTILMVLNFTCNFIRVQSFIEAISAEHVLIICNVHVSVVTVRGLLAIFQCFSPL